ncbi:signal peptidase II [Rhodoligotrophos ferricapiens]|uniref:signal peptidase II n=1 Tax=Rhodoligotrophos ferricapiens TaxID=3069264 RepID=UPI00315D60E8
MAWTQAGGGERMTEGSLSEQRSDRLNVSVRRGWIIALLCLAVDQAFKWWMLAVYDIAARGVVQVTSFFDLVLVWNRGVSYGWFTQHSAAGRWLLVGLSLAVIIGLSIWLSINRRPLANLALGMIVGGAVGNLIDRLVHGAVADFFSFHAFGYSWYVFNIADVAIVAGVAALLYDCWQEGHGTDQ